MTEAATKTCARCSETKTPDDFHRSRQTRDGRHPYCKVCKSKAEAEAYRKQHPEVRRSSPVDGMKRCARCGETKPVDLFTQRGRATTNDGVPVYGWCCDCTVEYMRAKGYRRTPEQQRRSHLRHRFAIEPEDYDRLVEEQGGLCYICQQPPSNGKLFIDHDHASGAVRRLLCRGCNSALGFIGEDVTTAERLVAYLREHGRAQ